ncbi:MAG: hypothetical protein JXO22_05960 [Phycisphaerae bacterium]|nr:hypothetical protein [Phycisphaerae bacterium]
MMHRNRFVNVLIITWLLIGALGGCPFGTATVDSGDTTGDPNSPSGSSTDPNTASVDPNAVTGDPNSTTSDPNSTTADPNSAVADPNEVPFTPDYTVAEPADPPAASPPADTGALVVQAIVNAATRYYDVYEAPNGAEVAGYKEVDTAVYLPPGLYKLTQYFNASFIWDSDVEITAGATTTVTLGAIELVTVANASDGYFDIYSPGGAVQFASYNEPNVFISAPAGTYTLKEYFNAGFSYATSVVVAEGAVTTVEMGGIKLISVPGSVDANYGIYNRAGTITFASYNEPDIIITAPPGVYTLKEYFNAGFTYANNVQVTAGEVTEVEMGAIRYNGPFSYDIYSGGNLVSSYNDAGTIVTAPPGTYLLTKYYDPDTVLAGHVVVTAGAITDAP